MKNLHIFARASEIAAELSPTFNRSASGMGTPEWADVVFSTPPARKLKGPSKSTQYHLKNSDTLGQLGYDQPRERYGVQGGNESETLLVIEHLHQLGHVGRIKPQPFKTNPLEFGFEIFPDFLVEAVPSRKLIVIETKSARFLTREVHRRIEELRARFQEFGMAYLLWTDKRPLNRYVRENLSKMRLAENERRARLLKDSDIEDALAWIKTTSNPHYRDFFRAGFNSDLLFAASWRGDAFFPITEALTADSPLSLSPLEDYKALFLGCENRIDDWWRALEDF